MGTYYSLNVVQSFETEPITSLSFQQIEKALDERFDLNLYEITFVQDSVKATLKPDLFAEHIEDFVNKLYQITNRSRRVKVSLEDSGKNIENYEPEFEKWTILDEEGNRINLQGYLVSLFIEGKVGAEEFEIEPLLINWLFRHSSFDNPLAGAIMSSIWG
ncbi:hypothetical protein J0895_03585 [Phormidium pseudopriestleyi FRX01]|uniref:Uncharacterized protein n=1 Tax=Phormidium pseudopriestleyi FRX01 TaxID=1759528 RepID=A0ABS3FM60_9CYAN|nr:hypothetical protein [Phormidium pseudopriestleyi]MBO0348199.1 hypothetical protein [Phormidium pseudopriestleyi FRX01]